MGGILVTGLMAGAVYALFAFGLVLVYKATRVLNFAQAEIGTFATFVVWGLVNAWHWPFGLAVLAALSVVAVIGLLLERLVIRPLIEAPKLTLVVATIATGLFLGGLELQLWTGTPKVFRSPFHALGPQVAGVYISPPRMAAVVLTALAAWGSAVFFRRTTFGLALLAAAQDVVGVRLTGIRLRSLSRFTWVASSVVGGLAGIIVTMSIGAFEPFALNGLLLKGFAGAIVGGMTSLPGALAGGLLVGVAEAIISNFWLSVPGVVEVVMFATIVLMLVFRPRGLLGKAA